MGSRIRDGPNFSRTPSKWLLYYYIPLKLPYSYLNWLPTALNKELISLRYIFDPLADLLYSNLALFVL